MSNIRIKPFRNPKVGSVAVIYGLLLVVFAGMAVVSPSYRSIENIGNIIVQCIPLAIVSMGQTIVIIGGGIDMSVGAMISMSTCIAAVTMSSDSAVSVAGGLALVLLASSGAGLLNGLGVNYCKVPPLITTLSMMTVLSGISLAILPQAGGHVSKVFADFMMLRAGVLSVSLLILICVYLLLRRAMYHSGFGNAVYAIGNHQGIAASMGVKVKRISILTYVAAGVCAGVTGLLLASRMRIGDPVIGTSFGLDSITASAIGGTSLNGGEGLVSGTIAGAFLIGMLSNMMNILGVNHFYQYVLKGILLVAAMIIYSISNTLEVKRHAGI